MTSAPKTSRGSARPAPTSSLLPDLFVLAAALILRLVTLWQLHGSPMENVLMGDTEAYDRWAQEIASGRWLGTETFYQAPLYPYFLGAIYSLVGHSLLTVRLVQAILGSISCVFLARAGREFFGPTCGLVAGLLLAFDPTAIFFDGLLQKTVLDLFLFTLLLYLLGRMSSRGGSFWRWMGAGGALGGFVLSRENALLLAAPLVLWLFVHFRREPLMGRLAWIGAFAGGLLLVLGPVALRNYAVGGELHVTTSQFGPNLYIGNNENSAGTYMALRPGRGNARFERRDAIELAEEAVGRKLTPGEVSRYWTDQTLAFVRDHFLDWVRLMGRKCLLVWNRVEIGDTEDQYTYADWSWLLRILTSLLHFGLLLPLAVAGAYLTFPERRRLWVLHLLVLVYAASVVLFFVSARYRVPLVPVLILFAAAGLVRAAGIVRATAIVRAGMVRAAGIVRAAGLIRAAGIVRRPRSVEEAGLARGEGEMSPRADAVARRAIEVGGGTRPEKGEPARGRGGRKPRAPRALTEAPRREPADPRGTSARSLRPLLPAAALAALVAVPVNWPMGSVKEIKANTYFSLSAALAEQGETDQAVACYRHALALTPELAEAQNNLAVTLYMQGSLPEALERLDAAVRLQPRSSKAHNNLAVAFARMGRFEDAEKEFRAALAIEPGSSSTHDNLGNALMKQGRLDEAVASYREASRLDPRNVNAKVNLARTLVRLGRLEEAAALGREAVALQPDLAGAHDALASALAALGKGEEAEAHAREAARLKNLPAPLPAAGGAEPER